MAENPSRVKRRKLATTEIGPCINDVLPTELIQDIIANLTHGHYLAALNVCRKWRKLGYQSIQTLDLGFSRLIVEPKLEVIPFCKNLSRICVEGLKLQPEAFPRISLCGIRLKELRMKSKTIGDAEVGLVLASCRNLESLAIGNTPLFSGTSLGNASDRLMSLGVPFCSGLSGAALTALCQRATSLRSLDISGTKLKSSDLMCLTQLHGLTSLNMAQMDLSASSVSFLGTLSSLLSLNLERTILDQNDFFWIGELRSLIHLDLTGTSLSDEEAQIILPPLSSLVALSLAGTEISDGTMSCLAQLRELRSVMLTMTSVTNTGLLHLAGPACPHLSEIFLSDTNIDREAIQAFLVERQGLIAHFAYRVISLS
eukprot:TRINITY_DN4931_c0_g1_i1.p1 TRINITY_DN4931_c0_g1~~TRINITY_DN4931_c0_g1_i1.p1  ORF type:complete len:390 (-),score=34.47 TRINITY_DN4931_c0_g1_i1:88-1197(-)